MPNPTRYARMTALSLAHGTALAQLLRAHGRAAHARDLEAALEEVFRLLSAEIGETTLADAVRWIAERTAEDGGGPVRSTLRH